MPSKKSVKDSFVTSGTQKMREKRGFAVFAHNELLATLYYKHNLVFYSVFNNIYIIYIYIIMFKIMFICKIQTVQITK